MDRLRFGTFLAPFHPAGENPTLALQRDLELIEHLDRLHYDKARMGELDRSEASGTAPATGRHRRGRRRRRGVRWTPVHRSAVQSSER